MSANGVECFAERVAHSNRDDVHWQRVEPVYSLSTLLKIINSLYGVTEPSGWTMTEGEFEAKTRTISVLVKLTEVKCAVNTLLPQGVEFLDEVNYTPTPLLRWIYSILHAGATECQIATPFRAWAIEMYQEVGAYGMWHPDSPAIKNLQLRSDLDCTFYQTYEGYENKVRDMFPGASEVAVVVYTCVLLYITLKRRNTDSDVSSSDAELAAPTHADGILQMMQQIGTSIGRCTSHELLAKAEEYTVAVFDNEAITTQEDYDEAVRKVKNFYRDIHAKITFGMCLSQDSEETSDDGAAHGCEEYNATRRKELMQFEQYLPAFGTTTGHPSAAVPTLHGGDSLALIGQLEELILSGYDADGPIHGVTDSTETTWIGMMIQAGKTFLMMLMKLLNGVRFDQRIIFMFVRDSGGKSSSEQLNSRDIFTMRKILVGFRDDAVVRFADTPIAHSLVTGEFWREHVPHISIFDEAIAHNQSKPWQLDRLYQDRSKVHLVSFNCNKAHLKPIIEFARSKDGDCFGVAVDEIDSAHIECDSDYREGMDQHQVDDSVGVTKLVFLMQSVPAIVSFIGTTSTADSWIDVEDYVDHVITFRRRLHRSPENIPLCIPPEIAGARKQLVERIDVHIGAIQNYTGAGRTVGHYHDDRDCPTVDLSIYRGKAIHPFLVRLSATWVQSKRNDVSGVMLQKMKERHMLDNSVMVVMYDNAIHFRCATGEDGAPIGESYQFAKFFFGLLQMGNPEYNELGAPAGDGIFVKKCRGGNQQQEVQFHHVGSYTRGNTLHKNLTSALLPVIRLLNQTRGHHDDPVIKYKEGHISFEEAERCIEVVCGANPRVGVSEWWRLALNIAHVLRQSVVERLVRYIETSMEHYAHIFVTPVLADVNDCVDAVRGAMNWYRGDDTPMQHPVALNMIKRLLREVNDFTFGLKKGFDRLIKCPIVMDGNIPDHVKGRRMLTAVVWHILDRRYALAKLVYPDHNKTAVGRFCEAMCARSDGDLIANCLSEHVESFREAMNTDHRNEVVVDEDVSGGLKEVIETHKIFGIDMATANRKGVTPASLLGLLQFYGTCKYDKPKTLNVFMIPTNNGFRAITYNSNLEEGSYIVNRLRLEFPEHREYLSNLDARNHKVPLSGQILDGISNCIKAFIVQALRVSGRMSGSTLGVDHGVVFCTKEDADAIRNSVYSNDQTRCEMYRNHCLPIRGIMETGKQKTYAYRKDNKSTQAHMATMIKVVSSHHQKQEFQSRKRRIENVTSEAEDSVTRNLVRFRDGDTMRSPTLITPDDTHIEHMRNLHSNSEKLHYYFSHFVPTIESAVSSEQVATYFYTHNIFRSNPRVGVSSLQQTKNTLNADICTRHSSGLLNRFKDGVWFYYNR